MLALAETPEDILRANYTYVMENMEGRHTESAQAINRTEEVGSSRFFVRFRISHSYAILIRSNHRQGLVLHVDSCSVQRQCLWIYRSLCRWRSFG